MAEKKVGELEAKDLEKKLSEVQKKLHELEAQKKVYELEVQEFEAKIEAQLKVAKSRLYKAKMKIKKWYFKSPAKSKEYKAKVKRKKYFHTLPPNWNNSKNYSSFSSLSSLSYSSSTSYLVPCPPRSSACPSPKKEDSQKKRKTASVPKEIKAKSPNDQCNCVEDDSDDDNDDQYDWVVYSKKTGMPI